MIGLTRRQSQALEFIQSYCATEGVSPSLEEIAAGVGLVGKSGAHRLVSGLEERGAIRRLPNRNRAIEVVERNSAEVHLRRIIDRVDRGFVVMKDDPTIESAREFLRRRGS